MYFTLSIDIDFIQDCDGSFLPWKLNVESVDEVILNHMKRGAHCEQSS